MEKKFLIKGQTPQGHKFQYTVRFQGYHPKEHDYGTGLYILVEVDTHMHAYLDCRYCQKPFEQICKEYLEGYWGANLKEVQELAD